MAELVLLISHDVPFPRCYAALGDVAKARYLGKVVELADKIEAETVSLVPPRVTIQGLRGVCLFL